ncbi:MAG: hypothetical protein PHY45_06735 [Rhodocyclaceae bacterium]|nr:hypothetical protein [Rhodocyclaceae bacterium]
MIIRKYTLIADHVRLDKVVARLPNSHKIFVAGSREDNHKPMCEFRRTPTDDGRTDDGRKEDVAKSELLDKNDPGKPASQDDLCKPEQSKNEPSKEDIDWAILVSTSYL